MGMSMVRLNKADLSRNYLNTFSPHLGKLTNLKTLSLASNYLSTISIPFVLQLKRLVVCIYSIKGGGGGELWGVVRCCGSVWVRLMFLSSPI